MKFHFESKRCTFQGLCALRRMFFGGARLRSLQPPLAVAATSPFPSIRLLASCWSSCSKKDPKPLRAFHGSRSVPRPYTDSISQPQRGYCRRSSACFRCGLVPLIPTPVSASRTLPCVCRARRRRDPCSPTSLAWRCCELARHSHACIRDSSARVRAWASVRGTSPVVRQRWQAQQGTIPRSLQC